MTPRRLGVPDTERITGLSAVFTGMSINVGKVGPWLISYPRHAIC